MPRLNRDNIDRKTNKPNPVRTEGLTDDLILNRAQQTRRDDDVIRTAQRTLYDIDFAIKWYIENEIRPEITSNGQLIPVPVIFANGEKWDNVRRLGYLRDEKGMLQSPVIMLKRNSAMERDNFRTLDVNRPFPGNQLAYKGKYNARNRYAEDYFPVPENEPQNSEQLTLIDIPKYVTIEYDMMLWCDFTDQLNSLVDQILPYGRFAWGNESNKFPTALGQFSFETVNTVGEDRLVRATAPLTVTGTLLSAHETRISTLKKMYSVKKLTFEQVIDVGADVFSSTIIPKQILQSQSIIAGGGSIIVSGGGSTSKIDAATFAYLTELTDRTGIYGDATTIAISALTATNPITALSATKNEFNLYINGQYIDKQVYTWTPNNLANQAISFNTTMLGYTIEPTDVVIINGRWA